MNMVLYDGTSPISWEDGEKTREEMDGDLHYPPSGSACVLFMSEDGVAEDWRYLDVLASEYDVEMTEDEEDTLSAIINAAENPLTLSSIDAKASDAKTTADSVQEQLDALAGIVIETEAANA